MVEAKEFVASGGETRGIGWLVRVNASVDVSERVAGGNACHFVIVGVGVWKMW